MRNRFAAWFAAWIWCLSTLAAPALAADATSPWAALTNGTAVLFRHAQAPGVGDPDGFSLDRCSTQRNLDASGRAQAQRLGEAFRARGVPVGQVLSSQWCRTRDTAELAFPGQWQDAPAFNSFFSVREQAAAQNQQALALLRNWRGPGVLVVVTHQVNITALTGIDNPASGEGVIVRWQGEQLKVIGRLTP